MRYILFVLTFILCFGLIINAAAEEKETPYVDDSQPFVAIKDVNRQAEAWAMCAATYDFTSGVLSESQPARSKQLSELANGAETAVTMTIFTDGIDSEPSQERFDALWTMAKLAGDELPKSSLIVLAAEAESFEDKDIGVFLSKLNATMEVCLMNIEGQQMYIDLWRELAKSGLMRLPEK